jgi:maleate cis-trans isomerase
MPYWEALHWIAVFGFLAITWIMMALGMDALFIGDNGWTVAFVWIFSGLVTFTLFWLVLMIGRKGNKWIWFLVFYVVFDLLSAFTFNYFHLYHNISRTQRIQNCIKYSDDLVGKVASPIKNKKTAKENMKGSNIIEEIEELKRKIENNNSKLNENNSEVKAYNQVTGEAIWGQKYNKTEINKQITADNKSIKILTDSLQKLDSLQVSSVSLAVLNDADSLCSEIQRKTTKFLNKGYRKKEYLSVRDSLVAEVSDLHAKLQVINLNTNEIDTLIAIVKLPEITHLESIDKLLKAFDFTKNDTQIGNIENQWVYQAVALSCLVDLVPMLLGLFIALSKGKGKANHTTFKQWWWYSIRKKEE